MTITQTQAHRKVFYKFLSFLRTLKFYIIHLKKYDISLFQLIVKSTIYNFVFRKKIFFGCNTRIRGLQNIFVSGTLLLGIKNCGFLCPSDLISLNIKGKLEVLGNVSLGKGCRIYAGNEGKIVFNGPVEVTGNSRFIVEHEVNIGKNTSISWDVEFLDDDYHLVEYENRKEVADKSICIGENVLIGSGVKILKGVHIGKGCVIAANSVVNRSFPDHTLIAGHPAVAVRDHVHWY